MGGGCDLSGSIFENCTLSRVVSIHSKTSDESFLPDNLVLETVTQESLELIQSLPLPVTSI